MSEDTKSLRRKNRASFFVAIVLVLMTIGLVFTVYSIVETLQENSRKLAMMRVKELPDSMPMKEVDPLVIRKPKAQTSAIRPRGRSFAAPRKDVSELFKLASSEEASGHYQSAIVLYERILLLRSKDTDKQAIDRNDGQYHSKLAGCLYRVGDYAAAEKEMTRAIELFPETASYYEKRAAVYTAMHKLTLAADDSKKSRELFKRY